MRTGRLRGPKDGELKRAGGTGGTYRYSSAFNRRAAERLDETDIAAGQRPSRWSIRCSPRRVRAQVALAVRMMPVAALAGAFRAAAFRDRDGSLGFGLASPRQ